MISKNHEHRSYNVKQKPEDRNKFVKVKPPYIARMSEVTITKGDTSATIEYKEKNVGSVIIEFGPDVVKMTKKEILERHNAILLTRIQMKQEHEYFAKEIPRGKPQIEFSEKCQQWVSRSDVLRCIVQYHSSGLGIEIDDRLLNLEEFGRMLQTYEGWGMRITFVPEDEIFFDPKITVEDPNDKPKQPKNPKKQKNEKSKNH
jgi:hypothetical protein